MPKIKIEINSGYAGTIPKITATTEDGKKYFIDFEVFANFAENQINKQGYTTELKPRQQYERLIPNNN